ncbi:DUF803-domain-containing protein [Venturia nashicola]|uniref:DUF803-domain-containing protein n=1 Tax=Venturia nashicola TaxID=86259 RepID=A0A4Z1P234_9PEZI|nr:DUF803-domain-containing protein [Venturia nashicola]TLD27568.1 DUF803-domain-containing protein [Venturia nashicola]
MAAPSNSEAAQEAGKYIGLSLAIAGTLAIGSSFVITKKGLNEANARHGFEGDGYSYLKSGMWWAGIILMVVGELANFAAYAFAPAILVTPLGALSVLIGAVLGTYFLGEKLGILGKIGCAICLIGSVIIVLHAPPDEEVETIDVLLHYAMRPAFMFYCFLVIVFAVIMIYKVAPKYGRKNPLVYISICSTVGSVSIMAIKAFGIALKLTFAGNNQFGYYSTYVFMIVVVVCILTQMNYFNKALAQFPTALVNPLYYVTFTTATLVASFLLFQGFNTSDAVNTISLLCGFLVIFSGVYLLNLSREDPNGTSMHGGNLQYDDAIPTDTLTAFGTRRSMQARRSSEAGSRGGNHSRQLSWGSSQGRNSLGDRTGLLADGFGLDDLAEDSDDEEGRKKTGDLEEGLGGRRDASAMARLSGSGRPRHNVERESGRPNKSSGP